MNTDTMLDSTTNDCWWGDFVTQEGLYNQWDLGSRCITIRRLASEWRVWNHALNDNQPTTHIRVSQTDTFIEPHSQSDGNASLLRLLQKQTPEQLLILPALADRSIVIRPATPLCVLPGESVTLYVSTPLWFTAKISNKSQALLDIPFWRPSDSWFGSSTREGEMCYAKYTDALMDLNVLERRQHRAITSVHVVNHADDILSFERISIPVPLLTLYSDKDYQLWTNALTLTRNDDKETKIDIAQVPPFDFIDTRPVNSARSPSEKKTLIRSLSSLFA